MELAHKEVLRTNRTYILSNLHNLKDVVDHLFENDILTESMKEDILQGSVLPKVQGRALLDILPKRGKQAFQVFLDALHETKNEHISLHFDLHLPCKMLRSYHSQPSQDEKLKDSVVQPVSGDKPKRDSTYVKKCKLLIINNINDPLANGGRDSDFMAVSTLFKKIGFVVVNKPKQSAKQVKALLHAEQESLNCEDYECFVLLFMSTGQPYMAYGFDDVAIDTDEIVQYFTEENCPSLANKPKIFIFQTCPSTSKSVNDLYEEEMALKLKSLNLKEWENLYDKWKNIFILTAIPEPEFNSWRNVDTLTPGSWFIQALVDMLGKEMTMDFRSLVRKLTEELSRVLLQDKSVKVASVKLYDSLTEDLYFFSKDEVCTAPSPCTQGASNHVSSSADPEGDYVNIQHKCQGDAIGAKTNYNIYVNTEIVTAVNHEECSNYENILETDLVYQNLPSVSEKPREQHVILTSVSPPIIQSK